MGRWRRRKMPRNASSHARRESSNSGSGPSFAGVAKRSSNACSRCRRQKIKCSGTQPCDACKKRKQSCEFDERDQKILVTRGFIEDLERQAAEASATNQGERAAGEYITPSTGLNVELSGPSGSRDGRRPSVALSASESSWDRSRSRRVSDTGLDPIAASLVNPLAAGKSTYITSKEGREFYLGTSSNWSFSRRVLNLVHEHVNSSPIPTETLLFDGAAYDLGWDGTRTGTSSEPPVMPSYDHAVHLVNTVNFHCSQLFHLFDETEFMQYLDEFYDDPESHIVRSDLHYIHLLVVLAFGKAFACTATDGSKQPPGMNYFIPALRLLPNVHVLVLDPYLATEVLCCIALFFQCIDYRHSSHCFIGQAMRVALGQGFHSDMPPEQLGERLVERSRKIWWTVYVLDREMSSLMGQPQSINDSDIVANRPQTSMSTRRIAAIDMHIEICRSIASVGRGIYGANGRLSEKFLSNTKKVLENIAGLADKLQKQFPLEVDKPVSGLTRTSGYLHLLYHQCVVLATRPLLLCFLKLRFENPGATIESLAKSQTVWRLIRMCVDSSYQMITILDCLQAEGLLETFLPFDLEALTVSSLNLLIAPVLDSNFLEQYNRFMVKAKILFDEFIHKGNLISRYRRNELQQLEDMIEPYLRPPQPPTPPPAARMDVDAPAHPAQDIAGTDMPATAGMMPIQPMEEGDLASLIPPVDDFSLETWFTTAQMMDIANSIAHDDTEWMSQTIQEHDIW